MLQGGTTLGQSFCVAVGTCSTRLAPTDGLRLLNSGTLRRRFACYLAVKVSQRATTNLGLRNPHSDGL